MANRLIVVAHAAVQQCFAQQLLALGEHPDRMELAGGAV
jgi:hypothetical protein